MLESSTPWTVALQIVHSAALAFDRVSLALGGRRVLADVSLAIAAGEFVGVLGPNGAGKTTLMRAVLGLVPERGTIRVLGRLCGAATRRSATCRRAVAPQPICASRGATSS